ncbi:hypothetical protein [Methylobacterium radiotolerans]
MPSRTYHPLSIRSVFMGHSHLAGLEERAAARSGPAQVAADVDAYISEIRRLLSARGIVRGAQPEPNRLDRTARDEALRISRALQWARSGSRIVRVSYGGPPGGPAPGVMRVGGIRFPALCVYVVFSDDFATPDPRMRIAGVYLGEGGSREALAAGWAEYVWALVIGEDRSGDALGSAAASWHSTLPTGDPDRTIHDALDRSLSEAAASPPFAAGSEVVDPSEEWRAALVAAVECALRAAALASVAPVVPQIRVVPAEDRTDDTTTAEDGAPAVEPTGMDPEESPPDAGSVPGPRGIADVVFGSDAPRSRNRWLVERAPLQVGGRRAEARRVAETARGDMRRDPGGYERGEHPRTYHRGTDRQFTRMVRAHPVKGERAAAATETVPVDRLDPQRAPAP